MSLSTFTIPGKMTPLNLDVPELNVHWQGSVVSSLLFLFGLLPVFAQYSTLLHTIHIVLMNTNTPRPHSVCCKYPFL